MGSDGWHYKENNMLKVEAFFHEEKWHVVILITFEKWN